MTISVRLDDKTIDELEYLANIGEKEFVQRVNELKLPYYILHLKSDGRFKHHWRIIPKKGYIFNINGPSDDIATLCFIPHGKKFLATIIAGEYNPITWKVDNKTAMEITYDGEEWKKQNVELNKKIK